MITTSSTSVSERLHRISQALVTMGHDGRLEVYVDQRTRSYRITHVPSGFAQWAADASEVVEFARDLFEHLNKPVNEALGAYQEPHLVRL